MQTSFRCCLLLQDVLDSIEFARGEPTSKWGSVRAAMGHPAPFELKYMAIGNEDCGKKNYRGDFFCSEEYLLSQISTDGKW